MRILDIVALNMIGEEVRGYLRDFKPGIVGITAMTPTIVGALETARIAREEGAVTVLGGAQMSIYPKETLSYPFVDYGVNGEGEHVMSELANALENKTDVGSIEGLIYKKDDDVCVNDPAIIDDLDALPFPAYDLLPMEKYDSIIGLHPVSTMISTRGCPCKCHFCFKRPADRNFRCRSPKSVVDEMEYLTEKYALREIMFYDDVMTLRRSHVVGICEEILSRNLKIKWETPTRINEVDKELLELMYRAGCIRLRYGIESGNEDILKLMNKNIDLAQARQVFEMTRDIGIEVFAYFMIGYAHDTESSVQETIDIALDLNPDLVMFTVVTPLPGTPLYALAREEGLISTDYWREFTLGRNRDQRIPYFFPGAEQWTEKAYRSFYLRPKYMLERLRKIRSMDDIGKSWRALKGIFMFRANDS